MFKELHETAEALPTKEEIQDMPHEKRICVYAPLIRAVCEIIKTVCFMSVPVKTGMDGIIAWLNEECAPKRIGL